MTMRAMHVAAMFLIMIAVASCASAQPEGLTTVRITDDVVVEDTMRLGINTTGDNYWDSGHTKVRVAENFEGVMYRFVSWGPQQDENGIFVWFAPHESAWQEMAGRVRWTLLGGPAKGASGIIENITRKVCPADHQKRELCYIKFGQQVPPSKMNKNGILLEFDNFDQGTMKDASNMEFWNAEQNTVVQGDVPPETFGQSALALRGSQGRAHYAFVPMWATQAEQNGTWRVQFWAKAKSGDARLELEANPVKTLNIPLEDQWKHHDLSVEIENFPDNDNGLTFRFHAEGGDVLLDDVVIWKNEQSRNPTAFRDPTVDLIKRLNPGILRQLQMGGSNFANNVRPRLEQMGWSRDWRDLVQGARNGASTYAFNMHQYYELCEYVGADPWYCVPGTLQVEEINQIMEYIGAPADVGFGKVRAELGQERPWTEVFDHIYIEFGNEAWNPGGYATGSYNGPDHWRDMIALGKKSPHYASNVIFVAGAQAGSSGLTEQIAEDWVPNADHVSIAPYLMNGIRQSHLAHLDTDDELFRWVFAYTIRRTLEPGGRVSDNWSAIRDTGKELSIYEHQFHLTNPRPGQEDAVPMETREKIFTSIGGGINIMNDSLLMMRTAGIRVQCLFNLNQRSFFGIPLWGFAPGINVRDQRYRPLFLGMQAINEVIGGDMVRTVQGGENPTFSSTGVFEDTRRRGEKITYPGIPVIWSYAFRDGNRRALVLFNLDTGQPRDVRLSFEGSAAGGTARGWWLAADDITASNEYDRPKPQVELRTESFWDFRSGRTIRMPAHSLLALEWQVD